MNKHILKLKLKNLSVEQMSLIITILSFCDDATLLPDCPYNLQKILTVQVYA